MPGVWTSEMNEQLIKQMDADGNGMIDQLEFVSHFQKAIPRSLSHTHTYRPVS